MLRTKLFLLGAACSMALMLAADDAQAAGADSTETVVKTIKFEGESYTEEGLKALSQDALLGLRNRVAETMNVSVIKAFKDPETGVKMTWKALEKFLEDGPAGEGTAAPKAGKAPKAPKPPKERVDRGPAKCAAAGEVKRPTREMFSTLTKTQEEAVAGKRPARWGNYTNGMTLLDCIETEGTDPLDVKFYVKEGLMTLTAPNDAEFEQRQAAWYKAKGRKNPAEEKAEREKAKADKAAADKAAAEEAAKTAAPAGEATQTA